MAKKKFKKVRQIIESAESLLHDEKAIAVTAIPVIRELIQITKALVNQLGLNSGNSSIPPSRDPNRKRKSRKVKGEVAHTNTVESFFGLLKRGLVGTYHHVSEQHLQKYCTEFDFRFTHRKSEDAERADALLKSIEGKRLTYRRIGA